ncbi:MAG: chemotaxis protein CheA [Planctomycetota bacterium]
MSLSDLDPDILQDFLTESDELLSSMDHLMVELESAPDDSDLLNTIFRALHTIKGSSGFLGLSPVTQIAHASEDLLNKLRNAELACNESIVTAILDSVDVLRDQIGEVGGGSMPGPPPQDLLDKLHTLADGEAESPAQTNVSNEEIGSQEVEATTGSAATEADELPYEAIELDASKASLLEFMVLDLGQTIEQLIDLHQQCDSPEARQNACAEAEELADELVRSIDFFDRDQLSKETKTLAKAFAALPELEEEAANAMRVRIGAVLWIMSKRLAVLGESRDLLLGSDPTLNVIGTLIETQDASACSKLDPDTDAKTVLATDGVLNQSDDAGPEVSHEEGPAQSAEAEPEQPSSSNPKSEEAPAESKQPTKTNAEQTIRVDVERLESMLNLVGELVLQKNRVLAMSRTVGGQLESQEEAEAFTQIASDLDRITGELQVGVMKTRLQPLNKLFNRYPRVIRDLARSTGKDIRLDVEGGETEVDKSVIELLADPMVHIMRNSADHGIESPEKRAASDKPAQGTIRLSAEHLGSHVVVTIADDGGGIDPQRVAQKAISNGMLTEAEVQGMSDAQLVRLIFAPGFSTAEDVSDLSGRGVGMDVVNTNITKLNGFVDVESTLGEGTTVTIKIPLTLAIMQAMMIRVNHAIYAVPLTNIIEIVNPEPSAVSTVGGREVMRLRDRVVPLIDLPNSLPGAVESKEENAPFIVTVAVGTECAGLKVHGLLGQQDIVIKPLDDLFQRGGQVSGATVREDGQVSMILDVAALLSPSQHKTQPM